MSIGSSSANPCLEQDEGQNNRVGAEFDPARLKRSKNRASDRDAGHQPDENGNHSSPYGPNSVQVDEQHVQVNEDFDHHDSGIQDSSERDWHGERREPITKSAIYKGRK